MVDKHKRVAIIAAVMVMVAISSFVVGSALQYQRNQIAMRETYAYKNPVILDVLKHAPDNSLVAEGWTYIGQAPDGRYHYKFISRNHIMNAGQNWQNSFITGAAGAGTLKWIELGTTDWSGYADVSVQGGNIMSSFSQTGKLAVQNTAIGAAGSGTLTFTLIATFTADAAITGVDLAGLTAGTFTQVQSPTLWAETTFAAVTMASGDREWNLVSNPLQTLTITWTVTSGGA
jgi:hypothetical protein